MRTILFLFLFGLLVSISFARFVSWYDPSPVGESLHVGVDFQDPDFGASLEGVILEVKDENGKIHEFTIMKVKN